LQLAGRDCETHRRDIEVLDHGGHRDVDVQVVNILPLVALKAVALESRGKDSQGPSDYARFLMGDAGRKDGEPPERSSQ
jgi:hypothetical protein